MEIRDMQAFFAIVEEGNISHAASRLDMAQPALSRQMKRLEESLGVQLFERGSRHIRLTDSGRLLYDRVSNILNMVDGTVREISEIGSGIAGTIKIGTITSSGSMLLPELVARFSKKYPKVKFELWEGDGARILQLLNSHIIELAVTRTRVKDSAYKSIVLPEEPLVMAMHRELCSCGERDDVVRLEEIKDMPLIIPLRWKSMFEDYCKRKHFEPNIFSVSDSLVQNMLWTQLGIGISLLPLSARSMADSEKVIFKRLEDSEMSTHTVVSWLGKRMMSTSCDRFLKMFEEMYCNK